MTAPVRSALLTPHQAKYIAALQALQERIAKLERLQRNQLIAQLTHRMTQKVRTEYLFTLQWAVK